MRPANIAAIIVLAVLSTAGCGSSGNAGRTAAGWRLGAPRAIAHGDVDRHVPSTSSSGNPQRGSACLTTPTTGDSTVLVDWVDFVQLHGIQYVACLDGNARAVASDQLGSAAWSVECQLSLLKFEVEPAPRWTATRHSSTSAQKCALSRVTSHRAALPLGSMASTAFTWLTPTSTESRKRCHAPRLVRRNPSPHRPGSAAIQVALTAFRRDVARAPRHHPGQAVGPATVIANAAAAPPHGRKADQPHLISAGRMSHGDTDLRKPLPQVPFLDRPRLPTRLEHLMGGERTSCLHKLSRHVESLLRRQWLFRYRLDTLSAVGQRST